jgi:predicted Kef-type K+ transport protein
MSLKYIIVAGTLRLLSSATASIRGPDVGTSPAELHTVSLTAAGLAQISEVSFFIAGRAKRQHLIGRETHFVLLAITSLSLAFAPLLWTTVSFFTGNHRRGATSLVARKESGEQARMM